MARRKTRAIQLRTNNQSTMTNLVDSILQSIASINRARRLFLTHLFSTLILAQGKVTFRNLSRYSCFQNERSQNGTSVKLPF